MLLKTAGEEVTIDNILSVVESMPRRREQLNDEQWKKGFCYTLLSLAHERRGQSRSFRLDYEYFTAYIPSRSPETLSMLVEAFQGVIGGIYGKPFVPQRKLGPVERWARKLGW